MTEFSEIVHCIENSDFNTNYMYLKLTIYSVVICYLELKTSVRERNSPCILNTYLYILTSVKVVQGSSILCGFES